MTKPDELTTTTAEQTASATADRELVITRTFDAPRELVFRAWTDPQQIAQWWGPVGFTNTVHEMDVRPGGVFRVSMHGPDGTDYPNKIVYEEVVRPERLVYTHDGDIENDPGRFHVTVNFVSLGKKTEVTMRGVFVSKEVFDTLVKEFGVLEGGEQTFDRLGKFLESIGEN
ncbi:MAG TPA: SRPBCC family protein [Puia sp.]|nr:SRPBCC family protein [Puia sp.]